MSSQIQHFGTQIELDFRDFADSPSISAEVPVATGATTATDPTAATGLTTCTTIVAPRPTMAIGATPVTSTTTVTGTTASEPLSGAQLPGTSTCRIRTVSDLLSVLPRLGHPPAGQLAMMGTAARHACDYVGLIPEQCPVEKLLELDDGFKPFLLQRRYSRNSARTYWNHVRMLVQAAKDLGWDPAGNDEGSRQIEECWREIVAKMAGTKYKVCIPIVRYAVKQHRLPGGFGDSDLVAWAERALHLGRAPQYVSATQRQFRRAVESLGLAAQLSAVSRAAPRSTYGIRFDRMPQELQNEITELLEWKQAFFAPGRSRKGRNRGRHRPVTAQFLKDFLCRLYGYAITFCKKEPVGLVDMVTPEVISNFSAWFLNKRQKKSASLKSCLVLLPGLFRHSRYNGKDFSWLNNCIDDLPPDPESAIQEAKQRKWVDFEVLRSVPQKIRSARLAISNMPRGDVASSVRDELLLAWLTHFYWRQRNLRQCRIAPQDKGGNLFKARLPSGCPMDVPRWAQEALENNPDETFWQVYFREEETKMGSIVRSLVPRALVPLLEEYLQHHRPVLLQGCDPGFLFLSDSGNALIKQQVTDLVGRITRKYAGRRVTPHLFRDIFAVYWLKHHPAEITVVSRALWHKNLQTTSGKYARAFDASHALGHIEECLEKEDHGQSG